MLIGAILLYNIGARLYKMKIKFLKKYPIYLFIIGIIFPYLAVATDYSSSGFKVKDPVISQGSKNASSSSFQLNQSISQSAIGQSTSTSFQLFSGFQYFFKAGSSVLSATGGDSQVSLSWTLPQTFSGTVIGNYELGVGTSSGNLTYQNVGNVLNFVKTGLSNGTQYFFAVRARSPGGLVLSYSSEVSSTPQAASTPSQSGGGGGAAFFGSAEIQGLTAPDSKVFILKNSIIISETKSDALGGFGFSLKDQPAGQYTYALYFEDPDGYKSALLNIFLDITKNQTLKLSGILLPPTLNADKSVVKTGENIEFFGYGPKSSGIGLLLEDQNGKQQDLSAFTQSTGKFKFDFKAGVVKMSFKAKAKAVIGGRSSIFSPTVFFDVGDENKSADTGICPQKGDLNSDCKVNLVDFSILAYWFEKENPTKSADFNGDGIVDLVDFSILAFFWTG